MSVSEDRLREALRAVAREVEVSEEDTAHAQHRVAHLRTRQVSQNRHRSVSALMAAAAVLAVALGSAIVLQNSETRAVAPAAPYRGVNGWVAVGTGDTGGGIHLVRAGEDARRLEVAGSEAASEACPVWSPDGTRLLFGRVTGSSSSTSGDPELVVVPVDESGEAGPPTVIGLDGFEVLKGFDPHPCGLWAPDGRWVALAGGGEVWVVDVQTGEIRRLPGLRPSDLEWRPGSDELAIAGDLGPDRGADTLSTAVTVYTLSTGELRQLGSGGAAHITWSPDGTTLAYAPGENDPQELRLIDHDGGIARLLVADLGEVNHGIGPVWSPTGDRIAYQRLIPTGSEEHEVVLVDAADGTETVIAPPETDGWVWYPSTVTWSPDGSTLLYAAWSLGDEGSDGRSGLIAVPADTPDDVTVLADAVSFGPDAYGHQWAPTQRWGRGPAGATDAVAVPSASPEVTDSDSTVVEGPGTGSVFFAGGESVEATLSLSAGYTTEDVFVFQSDTDPIVGLAFFDVANIYSDPCRWVLLDPPVGPTVDDLVSAFQESSVFDATSPTDVTVDGYPGRYIEVTVPDYDEAACSEYGLFKEDGHAGAHPNFWAQAPRETLQMWILDIDGTRLVVAAGYYPDTSEEDRQALADMVGTVDIG